MSTTSTILPSIICVTGADIQHGEAFSEDGNCPVGLALRRAFEALGYIVTDAMVVQQHADIGYDGGYFIVGFPDEVAEFIQAFDDGYDVTSITFVPDYIFERVRI